MRYGLAYADDYEERSFWPIVGLPTQTIPEKAFWQSAWVAHHLENHKRSIPNNLANRPYQGA